MPLVAGGGAKGAQLASDGIARAFWKEAGVELARVSKGQASRLSATGAEAFARACSAAKDSAAKLSFATKISGGKWRSVAAISSLEAALRKHAASQRPGHRATTSISGPIVSLTYDPPGFILATQASKRSVRMPSALRERARKLWRSCRRASAGRAMSQPYSARSSPVRIGCPKRQLPPPPLR